MDTFILSCFLGLQWIFHRCLRCAEISKMAEAKDLSETKKGKSKEK